MARADRGGETPALHQAPRHVAIIMDGNGRWARARGLPRAMGHRAGADNLRRVLPAAIEFGIDMLTIYAFSTENWSRPEREVDALMSLLERVIDTELNELERKGVRIHHIGATCGLAPRLLAKLRHAEAMTRHNKRLVVNAAINYGGRADIVQAVRRLIDEGVPADQIDEEAVGSRLWTAGMPGPDLIIRTAGEMRLSNFLIWQAAYAEYYSTPTFWPDFDREELRKALLDYQHRERRFGGLNPKG